MTFNADDMRDIVALMEGASEPKAETSDFELINELNAMDIIDKASNAVSDATVKMAGAKATAKGFMLKNKRQRRIMASLKGYVAETGARPEKEGNWKDVIESWLRIHRPMFMAHPEFWDEVEAIIDDEKIFSRVNKDLRMNEDAQTASNDNDETGEKPEEQTSWSMSGPASATMDQQTDADAETGTSSMETNERYLKNSGKSLLAFITKLIPILVKWENKLGMEKNTPMNKQAQQAADKTQKTTNAPSSNDRDKVGPDGSKPSSTKPTPQGTATTGTSGNITKNVDMLFKGQSDKNREDQKAVIDNLVANVKTNDKNNDVDDELMSYLRDLVSNAETQKKTEQPTEIEEPSPENAPFAPDEDEHDHEDIDPRDQSNHPRSFGRTQPRVRNHDGSRND